MRWFWRLLTFLVLLTLLRSLSVPQPKAFIAWPEEKNWALKIQGEIKQFQKFQFFNTHIFILIKINFVSP